MPARAPSASFLAGTILLRGEVAAAELLLSFLLPVAQGLRLF